MSKPLKAILTFHLKNGKEYTDECAVIEKISDNELTMSSKKPYKIMPDDMNNATVMILHGNSSRLLFSVSEMEKEPEYRKAKKDKYPNFIYRFLPPQPKIISLPTGTLTVPCSGYNKLQAITKPKNLNSHRKVAS